MENTLPDYESASPIVREHFRVDDDGKATWAMRKLRAVEAKIEENRRIAADERARIEEWLERVNDHLATDADYFRGLLIDYARQEREQHNRKSIDTPYGKIKSRQGGVKYDIYNPGEFLDWARHNCPDLIRVTEAPNKNVIADYLSAVNGKVVSQAGEIVPGVDAKAPEVSYTVEVEL